MSLSDGQLVRFPPPYPTWGGMLSLGGLDHMYRAPWLAIWPAVAWALAVFGFNMLGDALRDCSTPDSRGADRHHTYGPRAG